MPAKKHRRQPNPWRGSRIYGAITGARGIFERAFYSTTRPRAAALMCGTRINRWNLNTRHAYFILLASILTIISLLLCSLGMSLTSIRLDRKKLFLDAVFSIRGTALHIFNPILLGRQSRITHKFHAQFTCCSTLRLNFFFCGFTRRKKNQAESICCFHAQMHNQRLELLRKIVSLTRHSFVRYAVHATM